MIDLTPVSFTTCTTFLREKHNSVWKLSAGKAIECYGNNLMSCSRGNLKDKNDEKKMQTVEALLMMLQRKAKVLLR